MILRPLAFAALVAATLIWPAAASAQSKSSSVDFQAFVRSLWPEAQAKGITRATFDQRAAEQHLRSVA